ncbi:hypothetical protein [Actinoplanes xinjiangensis]|uniref:Uncharacterized protein n=1 Tax=Actinoplanes xinjiangensis TaxID=512350 RepID=A0A316F530_9ACTN|nr:hypothetical protein [Actinoplanes xinjiangensis]PWK39481.1 hypothetical protein BC793_12253 [Actinoplanes xinjiangensis]GIF42655.1 hypothetical protein Axi01nite_69660 [Actinoplanes xinjiangensis]
MRISTTARVVWGGALLIAPQALLRAGAGRDASRAAITVARVLGARHLLQAAVTMAAPTPRVVAFGAVVDALHAVQQLTLAVVSPRWRAAALVDTAIAVALAAAPASGRRGKPARRPV